MRSHFRQFDRAGLRCARELKTTIQARGTISLTWFAHESLRRPRLVRLSFDERSHVLKIAAARVEDEHTFPVRQEGGSTYVIAASKFTQRFGIDTTTARRYEATVKDGKLLVDLKQEPELVSKHRATNKAPDPAAPAEQEAQAAEQQMKIVAERTTPTQEQQSLAETAEFGSEEFMQALFHLVERYTPRKAG